jgi:CheY-like chemotaxis protein
MFLYDPPPSWQMGKVSDQVVQQTAMPVMDGIRATSILRTSLPFTVDPKIPTTPIIAMTPISLRVPGQTEEWLKRGFDDVLPKPFRLETLRMMLLYWSKRRIFPRQGTLSAPETGKVVPIPVSLVPWGPSPLRRYKGPRSLL